MRQFNKEEAISFAKQEKWKDLSYEERTVLQLNQELLCMPFNVFHEATEKALDRPVWTHEFAYADRLKDELLKKRSVPTMQEIIDLIPKEKLVILVGG